MNRADVRIDVENRGIITTYLSVRLLVISGFPNTYPTLPGLTEGYFRLADYTSCCSLGGLAYLMQFDLSGVDPAFRALGS
jgi:hypothetical protein